MCACRPETDGPGVRHPAHTSPDDTCTFRRDGKGGLSGYSPWWSYMKDERSSARSDRSTSYFGNHRPCSLFPD